ISSTVTPLLRAPLTCSLISGARFKAVSIARFIKLRVFRSSVPSPQAQPHAHAVVARWKDIMNSSARAIEASTYSGPSTSRRIGMPFWNRASSSAISFSLLQPVAGTLRAADALALLVEPDRCQVLVDIMARANLPAFDIA